MFSSLISARYRQGTKSSMYQLFCLAHLHLRNLELLGCAQRRVNERVASVGRGKGSGDRVIEPARAKTGATQRKIEPKEEQENKKGKKSSARMKALRLEFGTESQHHDPKRSQTKAASFHRIQLSPRSLHSVRSAFAAFKRLHTSVNPWGLQRQYKNEKTKTQRKTITAASAARRTGRAAG